MRDLFFPLLKNSKSVRYPSYESNLNKTVGLHCVRFIFVPPADAEQNCAGLLEQSVSETYKHNLNPTYEKGSDT